MIGLILAVSVSTAPPQGAIDPSCTIEKVCKPGYTSTIRPPVSYTNHLKVTQMEQRGLAGPPSDYEEDHFIPLELCGCPTCPANLWPQIWPEARKKDRDETRLHREVCKGQKTLQEAQDEIRGLWGK